MLTTRYFGEGGCGKVLNSRTLICWQERCSTPDRFEDDADGGFDIKNERCCVASSLPARWGCHGSAIEGIGRAYTAAADTVFRW
jgi:hypothetical protein